MKYISKIIIISFLVLAICIVFSNNVHATGTIISDADEFLTKGNAIGTVINEVQLKETSSFMYKLLMAVGIVVMFIVGTIIGIQYMVASAEDKAKVKEALIPYIIGCAVIFGAFTIWSIAINIGQDITGATSTPSSPSGNGNSVSQTTCPNCNNPQPYGAPNKNKCMYCGSPM